MDADSMTDMAKALCENNESIGKYLQTLDSSSSKAISRVLKSGTNVTTTLEVKGQIKIMSGDFFAGLVYFTLALTLLCGGVDGRPAEDSKDTYARLKERARSARNELMAQFRREVSRTETNETAMAPLDASEFTLSFDSLAGMHNEKMRMQEKFILPYKFPELYMHAQNNVLLYGPPGNGKTNIAKAAIKELSSRGATHMSFFPYTASELRSKWEGGTEANIKAAFVTANDHAARLEREQPGTRHVSFLFLDEIEALASDRGTDPQASRSVTTLLQQMDGMRSLPHVVVMAATNYPWQLDSAFRRRFSAFVFVDLPDLDGRFWKIVSAFFGQLRTKLGMDAVCSVSIEHNTVKNVPIFKYTANNRELTGNADMFNALYDKFKVKDIIKAADIVHPKMASVMVDDNETPDAPFSAETQDMVDSRFAIYRDNIARICGRSDVTSDSAFFTNVRDKLCDQLLVMPKLATETDDQVQTAIQFLRNNNSFDSVLRFCLFLALVTGPNDFAYRTGYVRNRVTYPFTLSDFGHSFSDLEKVMSEFFTVTASRVIGACVTAKSDTCQVNNHKLTNCVTATDTTCDTTLFAGDATTSNVFLVTGKDNVTRDMRTCMSTQNMRIALGRYDPTVGLDYCNLVVYNQSPDAGDPGARDKCGLTLNVLRSMKPTGINPPTVNDASTVNAKYKEMKNAAQK